MLLLLITSININDQMSETNLQPDNDANAYEYTVSVLREENELLHARLEKAENALAFCQLYLDNSHDLRSPLSTLKSFVNILEMENYECAADELKEFSFQLNFSAEEGIILIDKLLEKAKAAIDHQ